MDGGLICGYRTEGNRFEVLFEGPVCPGWYAKLGGPQSVYVLTRVGEPVAPRQLALDALQRAVGKATEAQPALDAYASDVADPARDFAKCEEYFCWATFERLCARQCAAVWLRSVAETIGGDARQHLRTAAACYDQAHDAYVRFAKACVAGEQTTLSFRERARTAERIAAMIPPLRDGVAAERAGVAAMQRAMLAESSQVTSRPDGAKVIEYVPSEYERIATRVAGHKNLSNPDIYPQPNMYIVTHLVLMRAAGWDVSFEEVAALSGSSALFAWEDGSFLPKYAYQCIDFDRRIAEATGFGFEWIRFKDPEEAWELLKESIDSGRAVKGWNAENLILAGYFDAAEPEAGLGTSVTEIEKLGGKLVAVSPEKPDNTSELVGKQVVAFDGKTLTLSVFWQTQ
jgi:hypothetical protein